MEISGSHLANGGAGKMAHAQTTNRERRDDSSQEQSSGSAMEKGRVIPGSGGDRAVISEEYSQRKLIDDINTSHISEEVKTVASDLQADARDIRRREAEQNAEAAQSIRDLAQSLSRQAEDMAESLKSSDSSDSAGDSETFLESIVPLDEQLTQQATELAAGDVAPDFADGE